MSEKTTINQKSHAITVKLAAIATAMTIGLAASHASAFAPLSLLSTANLETSSGAIVKAGSSAKAGSGLVGGANGYYPRRFRGLRGLRGHRLGFNGGKYNKGKYARGQNFLKPGEENISIFGRSANKKSKKSAKAE